MHIGLFDGIAKAMQQKAQEVRASLFGVPGQWYNAPKPSDIGNEVLRATFRNMGCPNPDPPQSYFNYIRTASSDTTSALDRMSLGFPDREPTALACFCCLAGRRLLH